jgi:hypothetical protein
MDERRLLGIYLSDHLAGSAGGRSLAKRIAKSHGMESARREGERLVSEIDEERAVLERTMGALGTSPSRIKERLAPALELVGRLKLNGSLTTRSPLSDLVELEGMSLGVNGKLRMWQALRILAPGEPALDEGQLDRMIEQAEAQIARLDALRAQATTRAFGEPAAAPA